jgi:hypothetical protein
MTKPNRYETREAWLNAGIAALRPHYAAAGYPLPDRVRVAIGFPSSGRKGKALAEAWHSDASADATHEIFIRPDEAAPATVLGYLSHELTHVAVPRGSGHGPVFKKAALAIGLAGKMRSALPGPELVAKLAEIAATLGPLPHGALSLGGGESDDAPKKQTARMIKCECAACGYIVRTATRWIMDKGAPHCPEHGAMTPDWPLEDWQREDEQSGV